MAPGVAFFVTLNEGYEYVGTNPIDEALRDRMTYAVPETRCSRSVSNGAVLRKATDYEGSEVSECHNLAIVGVFYEGEVTNVIP